MAKIKKKKILDLPLRCARFHMKITFKFDMSFLDELSI